ncbi:uncharacterized protein LOC135579859 isoform X2 [Columba livia]|uniref:uncharacterized protein LOC135579859 isoform X2 n=1 Tax=Columba livia TaxID=8932 RepID=UPI0031BB6406
MSTCIVRISAEIVGKKALINGTSLPPSPGKFLLLFLLFTTFPSFIPFSDLILLFPFPPQMLLLPPRSGGLLAAGDSQPLRRMAGARRKVGCCWRGHRCLRRRMGPTVCCRARDPAQQADAGGHRRPSHLQPCSSAASPRLASAPVTPVLRTDTMEQIAKCLSFGHSNSITSACPCQEPSVSLFRGSLNQLRFSRGRQTIASKLFSRKHS